MQTCFYYDAEELIIENVYGRHDGLLNAAQDFVLRFQATHGAYDEEGLAQAALNEGLEEEEIAAALALLDDSYIMPNDPRAPIHWIK